MVSFTLAFVMSNQFFVSKTWLIQFKSSLKQTVNVVFTSSQLVQLVTTTSLLNLVYFILDTHAVKWYVRSDTTRLLKHQENAYLV